MDYLLLKEQVDIHFLSYERLLEDFKATLGPLSTYLDLPLTPDETEQVAGRVAFSTLRNKDPGHVRKGKRFQWVDALAPQQAALAYETARPLLTLLGYPEKPDDKLPADVNVMALAPLQAAAHALRHPALERQRR